MFLSLRWEFSMETLGVPSATPETQNEIPIIVHSPSGTNYWSRNEEDLGFIVCRYVRDIGGHICIRRSPPETP
jgi:hypothetical protein